jgi:hypothetical protein
VAAKAARLAPAVEAAMARKAASPPPPSLPEGYRFPAMPRRWADSTGDEEMQERLRAFADASARRGSGAFGPGAVQS